MHTMGRGALHVSGSACGGQRLRVTLELESQVVAAGQHRCSLTGVLSSAALSAQLPRVLSMLLLTSCF